MQQFNDFSGKIIEMQLNLSGEDDFDTDVFPMRFKNITHDEVVEKYFPNGQYKLFHH